MRAIGMAERALEMMCERTAQRSTFGRPIIDHGVVQRWISEARVRIEQVRLLVLKTAWLMDTVGNRGARIEVSAIKVAAPEVATWVIDRAIQAHGGAGVCQDTVLPELYAVARILQIADGPDEVHHMAIARRETRALPARSRSPRPEPTGAAAAVPSRQPDAARASSRCRPASTSGAHEPLRLVETGADHGAAGRPRGDPLADDRELEVGERLIPVDVGGVDAGLARVALDDLGAGREALGGGDRRDDPGPPQDLGVARFTPERQQRAEIGQRIAERAHLPVEHGDDRARARWDAGSCCQAGSRRGRRRLARCAAARS